MCGITGFVVARDANDSADSIVKKMTDAVIHRGPDDGNVWCNGRIAFGHRRLSILDLSDLGRQPMHDKESGCVIVFNGEIYNYIEIRKELISHGYNFKSMTDTEVILKSYNFWGKECVHRFNGMWAFSIYDPFKNIVFCSRDRFGVKPFYYSQTKNGFGFSSEIRPLLPLLRSLEVDLSMLTGFVIDRTSEKKTDTFFSGIKKLPGGHNLFLDLETGNFDIHKYYVLEKKNIFFGITAEDAEAEFIRLLKDSIRLRLRSDVSVGTCLSGGMDSSAIATLAADLYRQDSGRDLLAITAVSEDPTTDESHFAQLIAKNSDLDWRCIKPGYDDFSAALSSIVSTQEEPFPSASICMQYFLMQEASKLKIPVLLDGQGGDEILLGYERYLTNYFIAELRQKKISGAFDILNGLRENGRRGSFNAFLKNLIYFQLRSIKNFALRKRLNTLRPGIYKDCSGMKPQHEDSDLFNLQQTELFDTNLPALLRYEDKNSMAHSIETRLPFLDYRLVEFSTSIPTDFKINKGWNKYILRKSMQGKLPSEIAWRKHKFGFEAPESRWMSAHKKQIHEKISSSDILTEIIKKEILMSRQSIEKLGSGFLWRLYSVSLWADRFQITGINKSQ